MPSVVERKMCSERCHSLPAQVLSRNPCHLLVRAFGTSVHVVLVKLSCYLLRRLSFVLPNVFETFSRDVVARHSLTHDVTRGGLQDRPASERFGRSRPTATATTTTIITRLSHVAATRNLSRACTGAAARSWRPALRLLRTTSRRRRNLDWAPTAAQELRTTFIPRARPFAFARSRLRRASPCIPRKSSSGTARIEHECTRPSTTGRRSSHEGARPSRKLEPQRRGSARRGQGIARSASTAHHA